MQFERVAGTTHVPGNDVFRDPMGLRLAEIAHRSAGGKAYIENVGDRVVGKENLAAA